MATKCISDLPDEILEFIFGHMPPYKDLESCALVCKRWTTIVRNVRRHTQINFHKGLLDFRLCWKPLDRMDIAPVIAGRFSHSAVVYKNSMFVFGGGSSTATTFNDLWRFDLSSRRWIRPISMGNYPSPKACATMVSYKNVLILFGGWRHPSTFPPYQSWRLFDELHAYDIAENRWLSMDALDGPPAVTGHSATIHNDSMIIFGGYSQEEHTGASKNDLWSLNLKTLIWTKKETGQTKPAPRYGQFQVSLSENHILIMSGCGGPNNLFTDAWLLDMTAEPWQWTQIPVRNKKWAASHMWCNPACKIGSKLVILGPVASSPTDFQMIRHQVLPSNRNHFERINVNQPPAEPGQAQPANANRIPPPPNRHSFGESSRRRDDLNRIAEHRANNDDDVQNRLQRNLQMLGARRHDNDNFNLPKRFNESAIPYDRVTMAAFNVNNENATHSTISPRERRLQSLRRMEEKIQAMRQLNPAAAEQDRDDQAVPSKRIKRNCIGLFVCDISNILRTDDPFIEWIEHKNFGNISNAPERLILSSLVAGNGELIMFGGLRKESLSKSSDTTIQVSNAIHFLKVPKEII